jgi:hypothetical protein
MKTCPNCRSANLDSAVVCVTCGTTIGVAPIPAPLVEHDTPTPEAPPPPDAIASERKEAARRATVTAIVAGVILVVAIAGLVLFLGRGDGFPDSVGGKPRITGDEVDVMEDALKNFEVGGVTLKLAVYGTGGAPSIIVLQADGLPEQMQAMSSEEFFKVVGPSTAAQVGATGTGKHSTATDTIDGVDYFCAALARPVGLTTNGSICVYRSDTLGVLISTTFGDPAVAIDLAREVADA